MELTLKPSFAKSYEQDLFQRLRKEVNQTVAVLQPHREHLIRIKSYLFPSLYILSYATAIIFGDNVAVLWSCYFLMGIFLVLNFLNLIHDAVHQTIFVNKYINKAFVYLFDLMGANSYVWRLRHIRLHHNYPNVMGWDSDIEQSPLARVFPHGNYTWMHKYQHIYLPLLYPLYLFNWLFIRDFKDFFNKKKIVHKVTDIPTIEFVKLFVFKLVFFLYILILPKLLLNITWAEMIVAFVIMMFTASIFSLTVLLPPHANTENEFPLPDEHLKLRSAWFLHQLSCTNDVKEDNWFVRFFLGSFNYHIAHHLFPSIHHVYYPEVSKVIEEFAAKNHLPYRKFPLVKALHNHYVLLKNNAFHENIFEETM